MTARYDVNLFDPAVVADPYPAYEEIRRLSRVVRNEALGIWMVPGYDDGMEILTDSGDRFREMNTPELTPWFEGSNMIAVDGPEHTRLRRCLSPFFTRQAVARWSRRVEEVVDQLLLPLVRDNATFDIVSDFTMIPTVIVAEMLGVPEQHYEDFRRWSHTIVANLSYGHEDETTGALIKEIGVEANDYLSEEIERHRRERPDDLMTAMIEMADMSAAEIRSTALLLVLAGYDTTAKLLANSLVVLADHPAQRASIAEDPRLLPAAIEEVIRWAGVTHINPREVAQDTVLGATDLKAGDILYVLHAAANRDPSRWPRPLEFDPGREVKAHLGFGFGAHLCLGAPLARLEAKIALGRLLALAPDYQVRDIDYGTGALVRGPEHGFVKVR